MWVRRTAFGMRRILILALICLLALAGCSSLAGGGSSAASTANKPIASTETATGPTSSPSPPSTATAPAGAEIPLGTSDRTERRAFVTRVIDGDTVNVEFAEGGTDTVQLVGVDTPEMTPDTVRPDEYEGIPDNQAARDHLSNWGQRAEQFAVDELTGSSVRVVFDPGTDRRSPNGHRLAYIYVGDVNFNRALLDGGYARVDDSLFSLREEFESTESQARSNDTGLWAFRD